MMHSNDNDDSSNNNNKVRHSLCAMMPRMVFTHNSDNVSNKRYGSFHFFSRFSPNGLLLYMIYTVNNISTHRSYMAVLHTSQFVGFNFF